MLFTLCPSPDLVCYFNVLQIEIYLMNLLFPVIVYLWSTDYVFNINPMKLLENIEGSDMNFLGESFSFNENKVKWIASFQSNMWNGCTASTALCLSPRIKWHKKETETLWKLSFKVHTTFLMDSQNQLSLSCWLTAFFRSPVVLGLGSGRPENFERDILCSCQQCLCS